MIQVCHTGTGKPTKSCMCVCAWFVLRAYMPGAVCVHECSPHACAHAHSRIVFECYGIANEELCSKKFGFWKFASPCSDSRDAACAQRPHKHDEFRNDVITCANKYKITANHLS